MDHNILYLHGSALLALVVFVVQRYNSAVCGFQKGCERLFDLTAPLLTLVVIALSFCDMCGTHNCLLVFPFLVETTTISIVVRNWVSGS